MKQLLNTNPLRHPVRRVITFACLAQLGFGLNWVLSRPYSGALDQVAQTAGFWRGCGQGAAVLAALSLAWLLSTERILDKRTARG